MILHPSIIALCAASLFVSFMVGYSAFYGVKILKGWNIKSGSEFQLILERKTYLISTILGYAFAFYLLSLFLYVFTVDRLHVVFTGAMCAAGVLKVNSFGYPTLLLKIIVFLFAGIWLIVNYVDNRAYDYPLIKTKYLLLLIFSPLVMVEMVTQAAYFLLLRPNVITSCCGSLFSAGGTSLSSDLAAFPVIPVMAVLSLSLLLLFFLGVSLYRKGGKEYLFAVVAGITFLLSLASIISFISVYYYELPTHHCPFCILQKEYGYVGYLLYIALLGGTVSGMGTGVLAPFKKIESLSEIVPSVQRRLALHAMVSFAAFSVLVGYRIAVSNLILLFQ
jgi:hypothetical protein